MQCVSPETEFWEMIVFKILNQHIRVKIDVPLSSSRMARTDDGGGLNTFYVDRDWSEQVQSEFLLIAN